MVQEEAVLEEKVSKNVKVAWLPSSLKSQPDESGYYPTILKSGSALLVFWDNVFKQWEPWYDQEVKYFLPVCLPSNPMNPLEAS